MGMKHIPDGQDFSAEHFPKEFGFHGSAQSPMHSRNPGHSEKTVERMAGRRTHVVPEAEHPGMGNPSHMAPHQEAYAHGGHIEHHQDGTMVHHHGDGRATHHHPDGTVVHHHAHGGHSVHHPHGHVEHHHADGRVSHHHADGHVTHHHPDGRVEHHDAHGGRVIHHADGRVDHHDSSEYVHRARGGHMDAMADKAMIKKAFTQHDQHMHGGEHETMHLRRGGHAMPAGMHGMHPDPVSSGPMRGAMGYGVNKSDEPGAAGTDQGIPQLRHGGRAGRRRD